MYKSVCKSTNRLKLGFLFAMLFQGFSVLAFTDGDSINMSKDLITLGIAQENLLPNQPSLDAGPAIEKTVLYAKTHAIHIITLASGDYYFNSVRNGAHLTIENANDLTVKSLGASFIFSSRASAGTIVKNCSGVGLENISMDYSPDLPFTSIIVSSIDESSHKINFSSTLGRPLSQLSTDKSKKLSLRVYVMRQTSNGNYEFVIGQRMAAIDQITTDNEIEIQGLGNPKDFASDFQKIKVGDILSISERNYAGSNALSFLSTPANPGQGNFARNVIIYSSPALGIAALWQNNFTLQNDKVIPKPNRNQFISSNADGINFTYCRSATVENSTVNFSGDDGMSIGKNLYAFINQVSPDNKFTIAQRYFVKSGNSYDVVDPTTMQTKGVLTLGVVQPIDERAGAFKQVQASANPAMTTLSQGDILFPHSTVEDSLQLTDNYIQQSYSRGIYLVGVNGATILRNKIVNSFREGILAQQLSEKSQTGFKSPENDNVTISENVVQSDDQLSQSQDKSMIEVSASGNSSGRQVNKNFKIQDNHLIVSNGTKSKGIFVDNAQNCQLNNNQVNSKNSSGTLTPLNSSKFIRQGVNSL